MRPPYEGSLVKDLKQDIWAEWLLEGRFAGNADEMKTVMDYLSPVRDKVLMHSKLGRNKTLVDVGCGDGLIGFGALEKWKTSRVIFTDISEDLLSHTQAIAQRMDLLKRCEFACVSAEALTVIDDESADAVTTRSVLIYVKEKRQAFHEFYRVLKPNGRISLFEPINNFHNPEAPHVFWGYDVTSVVEIAE